MSTLSIVNLSRINYLDKLEEYFDFALNDLLQNDVTLYVIENDNLLDKFSSKDIEMQAVLYGISIPHQYNLLLRSDINKVSVKSIAFHESCHLMQLERGDLKMDFQNRKYFWHGVQYLPSYPYNLRPWEIEAFSWQRKKEREYRRLRKKV